VARGISIISNARRRHIGRGLNYHCLRLLVIVIRAEILLCKAAKLLWLRAA